MHFYQYVYIWTGVKENSSEAEWVVTTAVVACTGFA